jgi:hypothetical protein
MVKKLVILILLLAAIIYISYSPEHVNASSYAEIIIGNPPEDAGEHIAYSYGFQIIEFWHSSSRKWTATLVTGSGKKELVIRDNEADDGIWTRSSFLEKKIHQNNFVLEYKVWHPQEVLNALAAGAEITPVMSIDTEILNLTDEEKNSGFYVPTFFFNFEPLREDLPDNLPEKPIYIIHDNYMEIHALPRLNCSGRTLPNVLEFYYPHKIHLVRPGFGSISYALYHHNGFKTGVGYSPDPFYGDMNTIEYNIIQDIQGRLLPGFPVTTAAYPERRDEDSKDLRIGYYTFASAGAVSIRFWYPIKIDYYAKTTLTATPTPTPDPLSDETGDDDSDDDPEIIPEPPEEQINIEEIIDSVDSQSNCVIKADERGNEIFDVSKGIPVRENLYVNAVAKEYLYNLGFTEHTHTKSEVIRVKRTYNLEWEEDEGHYDTIKCGSGVMRHVPGTFCTDSDGDGVNDTCPGHPYNGCVDTDGDGINDSCPGHTAWIHNWVKKSSTEVVYSKPHTVTRSYSYRTINTLEVYVPDSVTVQNPALPGGSVSIKASGLASPEIIYSHSTARDDHVLRDPFQHTRANGDIKYGPDIGSYVIDLGVTHIDGGRSEPEVPGIEDYATIVENTIAEYHVRNDSLVFNGSVILDGTTSTTGKAKDPATVPEAPLCGNNVFYKNKLQIPDSVLNGVHESSGIITYNYKQMNL